MCESLYVLTSKMLKLAEYLRCLLEEFLFLSHSDLWSYALYDLQNKNNKQGD